MERIITTHALLSCCNDAMHLSFIDWSRMQGPRASSRLHVQISSLCLHETCQSLPVLSGERQATNFSAPNYLTELADDQLLSLFLKVLVCRPGQIKWSSSLFLAETIKAFQSDLPAPCPSRTLTPLRMVADVHEFHHGAGVLLVRVLVSVWAAIDRLQSHRPGNRCRVYALALLARNCVR